MPGSASNIFSKRTPSIVIFKWMRLSAAGTISGVSCSWMVDRYPALRELWYIRWASVPGIFRLSCTTWFVIDKSSIQLYRVYTIDMSRRYQSRHVACGMHRKGFDFWTISYSYIVKIVNANLNLVKWKCAKSSKSRYFDLIRVIPSAGWYWLWFLWSLLSWKFFEYETYLRFSKNGTLCWTWALEAVFPSG